METTTKTCSTCRTEKAVSEFFKNKSKKDGHQSQCKSCHEESVKRYRANNKEAVAESKRRYKQENREAISESNKRYYAENPDVRRRNGANHRAAKRNAYVEGAYIPTYAELIEFYGTNCVVPGCENEDTSYEHIKPISKGGKHVLYNLAPMCKRHNSGKGNRHNIDYRTEKWCDRIPGLGNIIYKPYSHDR